MVTATKCDTSKGFNPIRRDRYREVLIFKLSNGTTISFRDEQCRLCKFLHRPISCRKHIAKNIVEEEPLFRMGLALHGNFRNCTTNNKLSIVQWKPNWWVTPKVGPKMTREAKVLWIQLKKFLGEKTDEGFYRIDGYISDGDLFRKGLKYGLITKDSNAKWVIDKPAEAESLDDIIEEKPKNRRVKK